MPTIAAIATPRGNGGIGIVRISGPRAKELLSRAFLPQARDFENFSPWRLHHGKILDSHDEPLDDVLAVFMPGPATYTGEDVAEVQCHGGRLIVETILENFIRLGARQAEPGEFTRRAFLNGRLDLSQAEAVAELIGAKSREAIRFSLARMDGLLSRKVEELRENLETLRAHAVVALDFPDDEVEIFPREEFSARVGVILAAVQKLLLGRERAKFMQQGALVALAGPVNAGKSSLLNALCGKNRALVCDLPGTTRDFIEEWITIEGLPVRLCDTAGLRARELAGEIEGMGMEKSRQIAGEADAVLLILDGAADNAAPPDDAVAEILAAKSGKPLLAVWNKSDLQMPAQAPDWLAGAPFCAISCKTGDNIEGLCKMLHDLLLSDTTGAHDGLAPNTRQALLLEEAARELADLRATLDAGENLDLCLAHLDGACDSLGQIIGLSSSNELLDRIFSSFCIGK